MRVLVTGGAGYIGTALCHELVQSDLVDELVVYDNLSRPNRNLFLEGPLPVRPGLRVRFEGGDILDTRRLSRCLEGIDLVVHLAARVTTPFADSDLHGLDQVNHWGSAELSYLLERAESSVKRLIYVSSAAVYGESASPVPLGRLAAPTSAYASSKHDGERMLERLHDRLALHVVRCANVYGYSRSMRFDAVINRFLFDAAFRGQITMHGSGEQRRAFVHVDTVARALMLGLRGELPPGVSHLVERNLSVQEIASVVLELEPATELLTIRQHQRLHDLVVAPDPRLPARVYDQRSLAAQLDDFRRRFAFTAAR
jgi:UDP-glucose 4-epimerase